MRFEVLLHRPPHGQEPAHTRKNTIEFSFHIREQRPIEKNSYIWWTRNAGNNTYCTASHYLSIMKYKEFHLVSTGALRASTLVSRSSSWTYPPPSSPSFSSLSSSSGFVMGESLGGVSFNTCCFCKWRSSSVARVDFLTCVTNALALFQNKPNDQKTRM